VIYKSARAWPLTRQGLPREGIGRQDGPDLAKAIGRLIVLLKQSRAGMPDEGLGVSAIGFQHLEAAVAGHVGDLDQVGTALHRRGHEASPEAVAGKGRGIEPELGGAGLDDGRDVAGGETSIRDPLRALVEDATEDSALCDPGSVQPRSQRRDRARDLTARDGHLATDAFLVRLRAPDCDQKAFRRLLNVFDVERHQFGAPEGTREAEQDDGTVAERAKRRPVALMAMTISEVAALLRTGAAPIVRRMPERTALTFSSPVGAS
jgi:hypothetical protein